MAPSPHQVEWYAQQQRQTLSASFTYVSNGLASQNHHLRHEALGGLCACSRAAGVHLHNAGRAVGLHHPHLGLWHLEAHCSLLFPPSLPYLCSLRTSYLIEQHAWRNT